MRSANKLLLTTSVGLGLLAGDQAPVAERTNGHNGIAAVAEARAASKAIAARYASCGVTKVLDFEQAQVQPDAYPEDEKPRNKVVVQVNVRETAEAAAARQRYDKDDTVLWMPQQIMARERRDGQRGIRALGHGLPESFRHEAIDSREITQPFYPLANQEPGNYAVFVGQGSEAYDREGGRKYADYHAAYCGTIVFKAMADGEMRWQLDPFAAPLDAIDISRECDLTSVESNPGVSYATC